MTDVSELSKEFKNINKELDQNLKTIKSQNYKINELDEKLDKIEDKTKITKSYLSGFKSIFGFFPKIFSSQIKSKIKENDKTNDELIEIIDNPQEKNYEINDDELEKEIYFLNENARTIRIPSNLVQVFSLCLFIHMSPWC